MDEFDKLAMEIAAEILQSEAASPGSQEPELVEIAERVLRNSRSEETGPLNRADEKQGTPDRQESFLDLL